MALQVLYDLSDSERSEVADIRNKKPLRVVEPFLQPLPQVGDQPMQVLSIWETQAKFEEAIRTAKTKLLIESPWIKRAMLKHLPALEKALERGVNIVILYGISSNDHHYQPALDKLNALSERYRHLTVYHLPTHLRFHAAPYRPLTMPQGTHRKLVLKDDDYYLTGSFNFLSFNKEEGELVANEESVLIKQGVAEKWASVFKTYAIDPLLGNGGVKE